MENYAILRLFLNNKYNNHEQKSTKRFNHKIRVKKWSLAQFLIQLSLQFAQNGYFLTQLPTNLQFFNPRFGKIWQ